MDACEEWEHAVGDQRMRRSWERLMWGHGYAMLVRAAVCVASVAMISIRQSRCPSCVGESIHPHAQPILPCHAENIFYESYLSVREATQGEASYISPSERLVTIDNPAANNASHCDSTDCCRKASKRHLDSDEKY